MRLINTSSYKFKEFYRPHEVDYAIISHRWSEDELTYQEFIQTRFLPSQRPQRNGWIKIEEGCRIAQASDIQWLWIDAVCIDKDSSAELSEAINSMYNWYKWSKICYVFLHDVHSGGLNRPADPEHDLTFPRVEITTFDEEEFKNSEWFTRGWTLQELLAPNSVDFFDREFRRLGSKRGLIALLQVATRIPWLCLYNFAPSNRPCVAERMKWMARRQTSRDEVRSDQTT